MLNLPVTEPVYKTVGSLGSLDAVNSDWLRHLRASRKKRVFKKAIDKTKLVRKVITDKTGRKQTKWVKPAKGSIGPGVCYKYTYEQAKQEIDSDHVKIAHGTVTVGGLSFPHAWLETPRRVYDSEHPRGLDREDFYKQATPSDVTRYTPKQIVVNTMKHGNFGPWETPQSPKDKHFAELRARAEERKRRVGEVAKLLTKERLIVVHEPRAGDTFLMLHQSTVIPDGWQVSYFDRSGPYGHEDGKDLDAVVMRSLEDRDLSNVEPFSEQEFMKVTSSKEFREGVDRATYTGLMNKMTYEFGYAASEEYLRDARDNPDIHQAIEILRIGLRTLRKRKANKSHVFEKAIDKTKLVRKVITDKRGRRTTKWILPEEPTKQPHKRAKGFYNLPATSTREERFDFVKDEMRRLFSVLDNAPLGVVSLYDGGVKVSKESGSRYKLLAPFNYPLSAYTPSELYSIVPMIVHQETVGVPEAWDVSGDALGTFDSFWISPRGKPYAVWIASHEITASAIERENGFKIGEVNNQPGSWVRVRGWRLDHSPSEGVTQKQLDTVMDIIIAAKKSGTSYEGLLRDLNEVVKSDPDLDLSKAKNPRLVPRRIVDKIGRRTLRWVKPDVPIQNIQTSTERWRESVEQRYSDLYERALDNWEELEARHKAGEFTKEKRLAMANEISEALGETSPAVVAWAQGDDAKVKDLYDMLLKLEDPPFRVFKRLGEFALEARPEKKHYSPESHIRQTELNIRRARAFVGKALAKIPDWSSGDIKVEARPPDRDSGLGPCTAFSVDVGKGALTPGFTVFMGKRGTFAVDDILDGGDTEFFKTPSQQADYFDLVQNLKDPDGKARRGGPLVLYTARPRSDRALYDNAKTVPNNLFLANSLDHVEGLAYDLSSDEEPRDLYRIKMDRKYLLQTLDGPTKYYQAVGGQEGKIPIRSISRLTPD